MFPIITAVPVNALSVLEQIKSYKYVYPVLFSYFEHRGRMIDTLCHKILKIKLLLRILISN